MTREEMILNYYRLAAAHKYFIGFILDGRLYLAIVDGELDDDILKLDRASSKRGGMAKIRIRLNKDQKRDLRRAGAVDLGNAAQLDVDDKYNKGERFERIVTERIVGEVWKKDSVPFNVAGDVVWNGFQVQVKLDGAELTNERTLARAMALAA